MNLLILETHTMLKIKNNILSFPKRLHRSFQKEEHRHSNCSNKGGQKKTKTKIRNITLKLKEMNHKIIRGRRALKEKSNAIELLNEMGKCLQYCTSNEEVYRIFYNYIKKFFPRNKSILWILSKDKNHLDAIRDKRGPTNLIPPICNPKEFLGMPNSDIFTHYPSTSSLYPKSQKGYLCSRITARGETMGMISILPEGSELSKDKEAIISRISGDIALALLNIKLVESLQELSIRDYLTNLYNRRYMEEMLSQEIGRATRQDSEIGLIMFDIDFFKKYNDSYGHEAGDIILRQLGRYLQSCFRKNDMICRFGGEEFLIILPQMDEQGTYKKATYLRKKIQSFQVELKGHVLENISISVGISSFPKNGRSIRELLDAADEAMYLAKKEGRNRLCVAS